MQLQTQEQVLHDRVNLSRLVRTLAKTVASEEWQQDTQKPGKQTWIRVKGTLHKVRHARKLLRNVELNADFDSLSATADYCQSIQSTLDRLESDLLEVDKHVAPTFVRPEPLLPTLPLPLPPAPKIVPPPLNSLDSDKSESPLSPAEPSAMLSAHDLLLSPSDTVPEPLTGPPDSSASLFPSSRPASGTLAPASTGVILQNSRAVQEELSEQLAQMAVQLKRNALHFSDSLEKDKGVVLEAQEKLERNHDVMTKERKRLRDHHSKSWGTTWITILSIVVAMIGFFLTFFVIRFT